MGTFDDPQRMHVIVMPRHLIELLICPELLSHGASDAFGLHALK
jgi:hypothetical protein